MTDPDSVLAVYHRMLAARRDCEALRQGGFRRVPIERREVLGYVRGSGEGQVLVLINFATAARRVDWSADKSLSGRWHAIAGSHHQPGRPAGDGTLDLRALEGIVLSRS
jgi:glycosidase